MRVAGAGLTDLDSSVDINTNILNIFIFILLRCTDMVVTKIMFSLPLDGNGGGGHEGGGLRSSKESGREKR